MDRRITALIVPGRASGAPRLVRAGPTMTEDVGTAQKIYPRSLPSPYPPSHYRLTQTPVGRRNFRETMEAERELHRLRRAGHS